MAAASSARRCPGRHKVRPGPKSALPWPVVVVSPTDFNKATKLPVIVPITNGGDFARRIKFAVPVSGIKTTGVVRCDQPRVLDLSARTARKVDTFPTPILNEVLAKVATLFL